MNGETGKHLTGLHAKISHLLALPLPGQGEVGQSEANGVCPSNIMQERAMTPSASNTPE